MSNEFALSFSLLVENGYFEDRVSVGSLQRDQTTPGMGGGTQEIGTANTNLDFGSIGYEGTVDTAGFAFFRNVDPTNWVKLGPDPGTTGTPEYCIRLEPGDFAFMRLEPDVPWGAIADTAPVLLEIRVYGD